MNVEIRCSQCGRVVYTKARCTAKIGEFVYLDKEDIKYPKGWLRYALYKKDLDGVAYRSIRQSICPECAKDPCFTSISREEYFNLFKKII